MAYCTNCGVKLADNAKFCSECGSPNTKVAENAAQRQQEFSGKKIKCPNCGEPITYTTAICTACGFKITGQGAVNSVQAFKEQLMSIETQRKKSKLGILNIYAPPDPVDKSKLSLIQNYPIPNTIDDILEFMLLTIANIDVSLSKKSLANRSGSMQILAMEMPRVISNAWVSKMQQAYHKAEMLFPNDPIFTNIQKIYFEQAKKLKIKV